MKVIDNNTCYTYYLKNDFESGVFWKKVQDKRVSLASMKKYILEKVDAANDTYKKYMFVRTVSSAANKRYLANLIEKVCKKASKLTCRY